MNPTLDFLFSRRSIRQYTRREIPETMLIDLLEAAMAAPSAKAQDPWHFLVLRDRAALDRLAGCLPNGKMLGQATAALIVCGDIDRAYDRQLSFLLQDVSAAIENTLLAAHALGLGACWLGIHPREERIAAVSQLFDLPSHIVPVAGIALGFPAETKEARTRFNPESVHWERWGSRSPESEVTTTISDSARFPPMHPDGPDVVISVIITTYNRSGLLPRAIRSVLAQTYKNFEIIVVDDGSAEPVESLLSDFRNPAIRYIRHDENKGMSAACNTGLRMAKGKYIAFLDDDDEWLPDKLRKQLDVFMNAEPEVGLVYSGSTIISEQNGRTVHSFFAHPVGHKDVDFLRTITFTTSVPLIRKSCFIQAGYFDESLPGAVDSDMWIRLARHFDFDCVPEILVKRYIHGKQTTTNLQAKINAKEMIISKNIETLSNHPEIFAHHLTRLGILYCTSGRRGKGSACFAKAIRLSPKNRKLYRHLLISLMAPKKYLQPLMARNLDKVDGITLYY